MRLDIKFTNILGVGILYDFKLSKWKCLYYLRRLSQVSYRKAPQLPSKILLLPFLHLEVEEEYYCCDYFIFLWWFSMYIARHERPVFVTYKTIFRIKLLVDQYFSLRLVLLGSNNTTWKILHLCLSLPGWQKNAEAGSGQVPGPGPSSGSIFF